MQTAKYGRYTRFVIKVLPAEEKYALEEYVTKELYVESLRGLAIALYYTQVVYIAMRWVPKGHVNDRRMSISFTDSSFRVRPPSKQNSTTYT